MYDERSDWITWKKEGCQEILKTVGGVKQIQLFISFNLNQKTSFL